MPAVVCHWLLGKRMMNTARRIAGKDRFKEKSFLIGCQGPDILFYHRLVSLSRKDNLQDFGHKIHSDHPSQFFASLKETVENCSDELRDYVNSYALGMCCHYAYDTCAHPYICQLSQRMKETDERGSDYSYHALIESALDTIMWRYETGGIITDLRLAKCVAADKGDSAAAAEVYANALREMYNKEISPKESGRLAGDMIRLFRVLDDPLCVRRPFAARMEALTGKKNGRISAYIRPIMEEDDYDYANITHAEWSNVMNPEEKSCEDFFEITKRAERRTKEMMKFFANSVGSANEFSLFTGERSFSNNVDEVAFAQNTAGL